MRLPPLVAAPYIISKGCSRNSECSEVMISFYVNFEIAQRFPFRLKKNPSWVYRLLFFRSRNNTEAQLSVELSGILTTYQSTSYYYDIIIDCLWDSTPPNLENTLGTWKTSPLGKFFFDSLKAFPGTINFKLRCGNSNDYYFQLFHTSCEHACSLASLHKKK